MSETTPEPPLRIQAEVMLHKEPRPGGLWNWIEAHQQTISVLIVVTGGLFAFFKYLHEEHEKAALQRQTLLVQFYGELNDKSKRNTAAYALATLSGDSALPVLIPKIKEVAQFDKDPSFLSALDQSLILIGDPALNDVLHLNRETRGEGLGIGNTESKEAILKAVQPVIVYFLLNRRPDSRPDFSGIILLDADLDAADLSHLDLHSITILKGNLCTANLTGANLQGANIEVELGSANLSEANLAGANLAFSELAGATFDRSAANRVRLPQDLVSVSFRAADLTGTDFYRRNLHSAKFSGAKLAGASFLSADLENADFTDSDLEGAKLTFGQYDSPDFPADFGTHIDFPRGGGAFVRGTNFKDAKHVSEENRNYLCKWGALNVPGGCGATATVPKLLDMKRQNAFGGGSGGCW